MTDILVVEDDPIYRDLLERNLSRGYRVHGVDNLDQAIEVFGAIKFNAVVMDIGLPLSDKYETVSRMKGKYPHCAIVVLSAHEEPALIQKCIRDSASSYLVKGRDDLNPETLTRAIDVAIANNETTQKVEQVRRLIENETEI